MTIRGDLEILRGKGGVGLVAAGCSLGAPWAIERRLIVYGRCGIFCCLIVSCARPMPAHEGKCVELELCTRFSLVSSGLEPRLE